MHTRRAIKLERKGCERIGNEGNGRAIERERREWRMGNENDGRNEERRRERWGKGRAEGNKEKEGDLGVEKRKWEGELTIEGNSSSH